MSRRFANVDSPRLSTSATNVAVATTSTAVASAAFGTNTFQIRVAAPSACFYKVDKNPTAAATDTYLPANWVEYVTVNPGEKISVFSASIQTISVNEIQG